MDIKIKKLDFFQIKEELGKLQPVSSIAINQASRHYIELNDFQLALDSFADDAISIYSLRFSRSNKTINRQIILNACYEIKSCTAGGWLLLPKTNRSVFWIPKLPILRQLDEHGHILKELEPELKELDISKDLFSITLEHRKDYVLDIIIVELAPDSTSIVNELSFFRNFELNPVFLWGSHTKYTKPSDFFLHFIYGHIYENRTSWPFYYKICSENDAHALFVTLNGLERNTGKKIYKYLKSLLTLSIISRQREDGGWYHGEWTTDMESHFRLHCSGMHLLMDSLSIEKDEVVEGALKKAAEYISRQREETKIGTWFFHDQLELKESLMKKSPFKWVESNAFGKRQSNMLVLNTHLDTIIALDRYKTLTKDEQFSSIIVSARGAAKTVFFSKPAEWLYKLIFRVIKLTLLPTSTASKLPRVVRAMKRIGWKYIIPNLHIIKKYYPRLNMPGGYIDRALSLKGLSDAYQSINLMDLCRFIRRFPQDISIGDLEEALIYTSQGDIRQFWGENKKKDYALGFWAEVTYHLCLQFPNREYRQWLVDAINDLSNCDLGGIPSILGGNREASYSLDTRIWNENFPMELIVADISSLEKTEYLIINRSQSEISAPVSQRYEIVHSSGNKAEKYFINKLYITPLEWVSIR